MDKQKQTFSRISGLPTNKSNAETTSLSDKSMTRARAKPRVPAFGQCLGNSTLANGGYCKIIPERKPRINPPRLLSSGVPTFQKNIWEKMRVLPSAHERSNSKVISCSHRYFIKVYLPDPGFPSMWKMPDPDSNQSVEDI